MANDFLDSFIREEVEAKAREERMWEEAQRVIASYTPIFENINRQFVEALVELKVPSGTDEIEAHSSKVRVSAFPSYPGFARGDAGPFCWYVSDVGLWFDKSGIAFDPYAEKPAILEQAGSNSVPSYCVSVKCGGRSAFQIRVYGESLRLEVAGWDRYFDYEQSLKGWLRRQLRSSTGCL